MKETLALVVALLALTVSPAARAQSAEALRAAPTQLKSDRAYILFRTNRFKTGIMTIVPVLMRVPGREEIDAYHTARKEKFEATLAQRQAEYEKAKVKNPTVPPPTLENMPFVYAATTNLYGLKGGTIFEDSGTYRAYLVEAPPGVYVIYGLSRASNYVDTCFCLGSVSFEARAGQIVDMGTMVMDKVYAVSDVPELVGESGFGNPPNGAASPLGLAIRRGGDAELKPASLSAFETTPARYRAVGPFLEAGASVNRLAPLDGILAYDRGVVVDVQSGSRLAPAETPR